MQRYVVTEEECRKAYLDRVCIYCGNPIEPIETVDNSHSPTFWPGCLRCNRFNSGTTDGVYKKAVRLKGEHKHISTEVLVEIVATLYSDAQSALSEKDREIDRLKAYNRKLLDENIALLNERNEERRKARTLDATGISPESDTGKVTP